MKALVTLFFAVIAFSASAQHIAMADSRSETPNPIMKEAYAINMQEVQQEIGYPTVCQNAHIEGNVRIFVQIDANGNYLSHKVQSATNSFFRKAVEAQVQELAFSPAYLNGKRVGTWLPMEFQFNLTE